MRPLIEGYNIFDTKSPHIKISLDLINPELKDFLKSKGIVVTWIETFTKYPGTTGTIHTDVRYGDFTKINWVFGGTDSSMLWYTPKPGVLNTKLPLKTAVNSDYLSFLNDEVDLVYSEKLSGSYLVQVGAPHSVHNPKEKRYCVSMVINDIRTRKRLSMNEALALLK